MRKIENYPTLVHHTITPYIPTSSCITPKIKPSCIICFFNIQILILNSIKLYYIKLNFNLKFLGRKDTVFSFVHFAIIFSFFSHFKVKCRDRLGGCQCAYM